MGEEKLETEVFFNASLNHKVVSWTGHKTGTTSMVNILNEVGFSYYKYDGQNFELVNNRPQRTHVCFSDSIPHGFEIISTLRNPFSQLVSEFRFGEINKFQKWIPQVLSQKHTFGCFVFKDKTPNYFVRVENMFDDYSKIQFIVDSKFYKSGILKKFTQYKMNQHPEGKTNWKEYYNDEIAKKVIETFPFHFSKYYDENSWK